MRDAKTDIAIIGMSCLYAGAPDVPTFWRNILAKVSAITDAPDSWSVPYYDPPASATIVERIYTRKAGFLGNLAEFDPVEFGVIPNAIPATEPDHFLALREAASALKDSGYADKPFDRTRTGVILGRGATPNPSTANGFNSGLALDQTVSLLRKFLPGLSEDDYTAIRTELKKTIRPLTAEAGPGLVSNVAAGRIANRLDLMGPSYMVDAACSSSLIAVDSAMKDLNSGRCSMMLVGGVQATMPPQVYMLFCQLKALSPTTVRPFDVAADGTLLGEGCGFIVLKRLADAKRDGDRIYAVLKGASVASDGRALGLLAPRMEGESLAMRRVYEETGIAPASVGHVEAHGTGIPLGDQTEIAAMRQVFGTRTTALPRCALGSVKSMIGHCIPAAGMASMIKSSLALYHRVLPPTLCENPNPKLGLDDSPLYINNQTRPWIHGQIGEARRAAINAFGFGGINAHILLEEYQQERDEKDHAFPWTSELVLLSAPNRADLQARMNLLLAALQERPDLPLGAFAAAAPGTTAPGLCRLAIVATSPKDLDDKLKAALPKVGDPACERLQTRAGVFFSARSDGAEMGQTVFLFPGQGSQYPYLFADLCMYFPQIRHWFDMSDAAFCDTWRYLPSEYVFPPPTGVSPADMQELATGFYAIDVATEIIFTAGMAMVELLKEFGLRCDAILGHSTGEYTALAASGAIHVDEPNEQIGLKRALNQLYRDFNTAATIPRGTLLTVGAIEPDKLDILMAGFGDRLHVAMDNCPHQRIIFGPPDDITALQTLITQAGGICQTLPFGTGYHTALLNPMRDTLLKYYEALPIRKPHTPLYSCATTQAFPATPDAIRATAAQQWLGTVRFRETILNLHAQGARTFIEMGPSSTLTAFLGDILRGKPHLAMSANERTKPGLEQLQRLLAQMHVRGASLATAPLFRGRHLPKLNLAIPAEGRPKKRATCRPLDLSMPRITVDETFAANYFHKAAGSQHQAPSTQHPAPSPTSDPLAQHFQLMHEFIESQRRCTDMFFNRRTNGAENTKP